MSEQERQTDARPGRRARRRALTALVVLAGLAAILFVFRPENLYLWVKALHIVAVISWMAGLLYLPRLFVYHTDAKPGSELSETMKVMEHRLFKVIMNPAMMTTWLLGVYLAWDVYGFQGGWLHAKIALVVVLTGVHKYYGRAVRAFSRDENVKSGRYWRLMNEVPAVLMICIVLLVVVKPF